MTHRPERVETPFRPNHACRNIFDDFCIDSRPHPDGRGLERLAQQEER